MAEAVLDEGKTLEQKSNDRIPACPRLRSMPPGEVHIVILEQLGDIVAD